MPDFIGSSQYGQFARQATGRALYIPPQRAGRIDNPDLYSVLYLSDQAAGAVAEAFGRFPDFGLAGNGSRSS